MAVAVIHGSPALGRARHTLAAGEVHVFAGDLDTTASDAKMLSKDEVERAARFRFDRDRHRFVAGRSILRRLVGFYLDSSPAGVEFAYGPQGKPFVSAPSLSFNVAHSGGCALFAFAPGFEVGIDVELADQTPPEGDRVAEHFFSPEEITTLRAHARPAQAQAFLRCWTRKEAFIKARGEGLSLPLKDFDVAFAEGDRPAVLRTAWSDSEPAEWTLYDISSLCRGAVAALAARAPEPRIVYLGQIG